MIAMACSRRRPIESTVAATPATPRVILMGIPRRMSHAVRVTVSTIVKTRISTILPNESNEPGEQNDHSPTGF